MAGDPIRGENSLSLMAKAVGAKAVESNFPGLAHCLFFLSYYPFRLKFEYLSKNLNYQII